MNTSCHIYEWVMRHIRMSRGTPIISVDKWNWESNGDYWSSHATHMNKSWHIYNISRKSEVGYEMATTEAVMSHIWRSRVAHTIVAHIWMSHGTQCGTYMNESLHHEMATTEAVMPHAWLRHVAYMNESCHTHERVESHVHLYVCATTPGMGWLWLVGSIKL